MYTSIKWHVTGIPTTVFDQCVFQSEVSQILLLSSPTSSLMLVDLLPGFKAVTHMCTWCIVHKHAKESFHCIQPANQNRGQTHNVWTLVYGCCDFESEAMGWFGLKPHTGGFLIPEVFNKLISGLHTHTHTQKTNMLIQINLCVKSRAHTSSRRQTLCKDTEEKDKENEQYLVVLDCGQQK